MDEPRVFTLTDLRISLPQALLDMVQKQAANAGVSVNQWVIGALDNFNLLSLDGQKEVMGVQRTFFGAWVPGT